MDQSFREEDVEEIISHALKEDPEIFTPKRSLPLAWNEGRLLGILAEKLPEYMHQADIISVLDDLRTELHSGLDIGSLRNLHNITKACRKCPAMVPDPHLPQWNRVDPDIAFIADLPLQDKTVVDFFIETLKRAGFQSSRVILTYVNRCQVVERRRPNPDEIANCQGYLHTELQLLQPKIIVPMGAAATAAVFGTTVKLTEERGRVCWLGPWQIVPIFSPWHVIKGAGNLEDQFRQDLRHIYQVTYGVK